MGVTSSKTSCKKECWVGFGLEWIGLDCVRIGLGWNWFGWNGLGLDWVWIGFRLLGFGCSVLFALARFCLGFASAVAILEICSARFALARFALFGLLGVLSRFAL